MSEVKDGGARAPHKETSVVAEGERTECSILLRGFRFDVEPIEQVGQIVSVFHRKIGLPNLIQDSGRVCLGVPNSPTIHELSHLVAHERSLAQ